MPNKSKKDRLDAYLEQIAKQRIAQEIEEARELEEAKKIVEDMISKCEKENPAVKYREAFDLVLEAAWSDGYHDS